MGPVGIKQRPSSAASAPPGSTDTEPTAADATFEPSHRAATPRASQPCDALTPPHTYRDQKTWALGGGLALHWRSDTSFEHGAEELKNLAAHLPGLRDGSDALCDSHVQVTHIADASASIEQMPGHVHLRAPWRSRLPADFTHLMYATARRAWLERGLFPVHAACVGTEQGGYILLAGAAGSGKTSLTLHYAEQGCRIFSADKTLIQFDADNNMRAVAGTHTITLRQQDATRFASLPKRDEHTFGDRLAFSLTPSAYPEAAWVPIRHIFLVKLNDGMCQQSQLNAASAVHTLYPLFMDKQREDVFIGEDMAFFDGAVPRTTKSALANSLRAAAEHIDVFNVSGSRAWVASCIGKQQAGLARPQALPSPGPQKILMGICGIGSGHLSRQTPVLQHLLRQGHTVLVFTYGDGRNYLERHFGDISNLHCVEVANPYFAGAPDGLDFERTANIDKNKVNFNRINATAMARAKKILGTPDLVISDYEQISARYAHAKGAKLVTLDQQSKYLAGTFAPTLAGTSYIDEVERLRLFFPKAARRLAVSFFKVQAASTAAERVDVLPPMIRPEVQALKNTVLSDPPSLLVYMTSQQLGEQSVDTWMRALQAAMPQDFRAHVFLPKHLACLPNTDRTTIYHHGHPCFNAILAACHGVVSTAGHTLLSESMYLEKPVYAVPLPLYEQQLNAQVIAKGRFGMAEPDMTTAGLQDFIAHLADYRDNIRNDSTWLMKEAGNDQVIEAIETALGQARESGSPENLNKQQPST